MRARAYTRARTHTQSHNHTITRAPHPPECLASMAGAAQHVQDCVLKGTSKVIALLAWRHRCLASCRSFPACMFCFARFACKLVSNFTSLNSHPSLFLTCSQLFDNFFTGDSPCAEQTKKICIDIPQRCRQGSGYRTGVSKGVHMGSCAVRAPQNFARDLCTIG